MAPVTQGDALELFANQVVSAVEDSDLDLARKFDPYWYKVVIDLASQVIQKCAEDNVVATLDAIKQDRGRPGLLQFRERALRHKLARNLPADARTRLTAPERDRLVQAVISTGIVARDDPQAWDACWGRLSGWSPVVQVPPEPEPEPAAPADDGEARPAPAPVPEPAAGDGEAEWAAGEPATVA